MTETRTEEFQLKDGRSAVLTVAEPEQVVRGGLVVLHEAGGVTDTVRLLVSSLAAEGWLAVAPHLYHEALPQEEQVRQLSGDAVLADTDIAFAVLAERGVTADLMGVVGFDLGATAAMVVAAKRSIGAAVSVGAAGIVQPISAALPPLVEIAGDLKCPWLGIYGEQDDVIDPSEVEKLRDATVGAGVATNVVRYPGAGHRFDSDPGAATEAWHRTLNWFDAHLR
ncbi:dienelactone hydrolase family protein [Kibdelosporangium phytohabitans]|uniref:Carboxymethylenebutenolidase n=1 Tax=Kibdelosporangium phytohabitans TaxID=860235 RepID=A0A0N9HUF8_9PSEU|nr:dienelactone hydrolase family protein [Kibdelosporangium phytohabitans]ALG05712.1 carboxymethylenebutenolidase [Kibdelosporangium phytohabitans]MBE1466298.1 carboxymethylenebutenolidase [Kibdelosporangium phytohabitans]